MPSDSRGTQYPHGLDWDKQGELHGRTVSRLRRFAEMSWNVMQKRHASWEAVNNKMTCFIQTSTAESYAKAKDVRKPIAVVLPLIYAAYDAISTQVMTTYFSDDTLHFYDPRGPEDVIGCALLESRISAESSYFNEIDSVNTAVRDFLTCGFCVLTPEWKVETGTDITDVPNAVVDPFSGEQLIDPFTPTRQEIDEQAVLFEGNQVRNVQPHFYLPDPNVPIHKPNEGRFVAWISPEDYVTVLERQLSNGASGIQWFNSDELKDRPRLTSSLCPIAAESDIGQQYHSHSSTYTVLDTDYRPCDVLYFYVKLVPSLWEMGSSKVPEYWFFALAADDTIIAAQRLPYWLNRFPVAVAAPETSGYDVTPLARLELAYGLQEGIDFKWNLRAAMERSAYQLRFLIDPSRVNVRDIMNLDKTRFIRITRLALGSGFDSVIKQLDLAAVPPGTVPDIINIDDWMSKILGSQSVTGSPRTRGERQTATEFQGVHTAALGRIDSIVQRFSNQCFRPLGTLMALNTVNLSSRATNTQMLGRWEQVLREEYEANMPPAINPLTNQPAAQPLFYPIDPKQLRVRFDCVSSDYSTKSGDYAQLWLQLFQMAASAPALMGRIDLVRMFKHAGRIAGAKNMQDFVLNGPSLMGIPMGNRQVDQQRAAGNLITPEEASSLQGAPV